MRVNLQNFIEKSQKIHGDNFDYSKFEYFGSKNKSVLICNTCKTEFLSTPSNHLTGSGCKICFERKRGIEVVNVKLKHKYPNWKFNFDNYTNSDSKIEYICNNKHSGLATYRNMIRFNVCLECKNLENLQNAKNKISNKGLEIINFEDKLRVECRCLKCQHIIIGEVDRFLYNNFECKYCVLLQESDLLKSGKIKLVKIGDCGQIHLECDRGHIYVQDRRNLLANKGCDICRKKNITPKKEDIFKILNELHGGLYVYDENSYKSVRNKINITCRKGHNFSQKVSNHLQGKGCPICRESFGERMISKYLETKKIKFVKQKKFTDCKHITHLPFDFYLPAFNLCIEYDGIQHYKPISLFGGIEGFEKTKIRDEKKNEYCKNNNIKLIRISYQDNIEEKLNCII